MARGGQAKNRDQGPERRCIATGQTMPKAGLIRFLVDPSGQIVPDVLEKLPGRGIWVSSDRDAIALATSKRLFARAARASVSVDTDLADRVERQLLDRVVGLLAMARKAGRAVVGYEKVKAWLASGEAAVLLQASDGSGRGKSKLKPPDGKETYVGVLDATELGLAFGREHVIHGALAAGGLTKRIVEEAARLQGLRGTIEGETALGKG